MRIFILEHQSCVYGDEPLQNPDDGEFGLTDELGRVCLLMKFTARMYNLNLNGTNIITEVVLLKSKLNNIL